MDFGDDPLVSTTYAKIHQNADEMLQPTKSTMFDALRARTAWNKLSLEQLQDIGVTAEMMCSAGMKWPAMQTKYGTDALVKFGFTWPLMLQCGLTGRHLAAFSRPQLAHLGINASRALECRPTIDNIRSLQLTSQELRDMGWTAEQLRAIGLSMHNMVGFGYSLAEWQSVLQVDNFASLGFISYSACAAAGWCDGDIRAALASAPAAKPTRRRGSAGELQFM